MEGRSIEVSERIGHVGRSAQTHLMGTGKWTLCGLYASVQTKPMLWPEEIKSGQQFDRHLGSNGCGRCRQHVVAHREVGENATQGRSAA